MFQSRSDAGKKLADELQKQKVSADIVLAIPRGGVLVGAEIARVLNIPLDVLVVKKLGAPNNAELSIGAIASDDVTYLDQDLIKITGVSKAYLNYEIQNKHHELIDRENKLRKGKPKLNVQNKTVVLTDDGAATGATVFAAIEWLKKHATKLIILALPVCSYETDQKLEQLVDKCVILETPETFQAVGQYFQNFEQVSEEEIYETIRQEDRKTIR